MVLHVWELKTNPADLSVYYEKTAIIDAASSVIWIHRARSAGEFEIVLPASQKMVDLFQKRDLLITRSGKKCAMIPEQMQLSTDADTGADTLIVSGRSAESLIGRRIVPAQWIFPRSNMNHETPEECVRYLIYDNITNPDTAARKMSLVSLGAYQGFPDMPDIKKQITGKNLLDVIPEICTAYQMCFRMDFENGGFVFRMYQGTNRSFSQSANPRVVFSPKLENIGSTEFSRDLTDYKNFAYIAGEGEGSDRKITTVQDTSSGIELGMQLREMWVDARQESSVTAGGTISDAEYTAQLQQTGRDKLGQCRPLNEFSGEIINTNGYVFGRDYDLGDTVAIVNAYGIKGNATVEGIAEVEDETGYRIYPELSQWIIFEEG